ncbi:choice-of-anchor G family protein, partial [Marisediminicola sp. LYQ134]|uniref:choice-of-anchor G family protein n=1 Tax=Marisediminicola sp. LYQ134 TaxID=3391061 RepID=UPI003982F04C
MGATKKTTNRASQRGRSAMGIALASATILASVGFGQAAVAAEGDGSTAAGRVLSGSLLSSLDADVLLALEGASASSDGVTGDADSGDLDATALSTLGLTVTDGVQIPLSIADLGVLSEYAEANTDGSAIGASGAVADDGTIGTGPVTPGAPSAYTFDLSDLLTASITDAIAGADLSLGAVSARASTDGTLAPTGTYDIAALELNLDSPVVGGLAGSLETVVADAIAPTLAALSGADSPLISAIVDDTGLGLGAGATASVTADIPAALAPLIGADAPALGAGGPIEIDLGDGTIVVDIRALLAANGQDLNSLAPGTEILSAEVLALITAGVANLVDTLVDDVIDAAETALRSATVTVSTSLTATLLLTPVAVLSVGVDGTVADLLAGTVVPTVTLLNAGVCSVPIVGGIVCDSGLVSTLAGSLSGVIVDELLDPAAGGLLDTVAALVQSTVVVPALTLLDPALSSVVTGLVSLTANVQEPSPGVVGETFTETALRLTVLGFTGPEGALSLDIAQGSVGPRALTPPIATDIEPERGPVTGDTAVTITGSGFADATGVTFGGVGGTDFEVVSDTEITVTSPANPAGPVDVVITSPDGPSAPLEFTYFAVTTIDSVAPDSGPEGEETTVTIIGSCFLGATDVLFGEDSAVTFDVISDTEITAVTPPGAGTVDVTVVGLGECGEAVLEDGFVFVAPGAALVDAIDPVRGPMTGGTEVTITGTDFTGATGVTFDGVEGTEFEVVSDTEIVVTSPANPVGVVDV